jgi:Tetratricopeptide repeat.
MLIPLFFKCFRLMLKQSPSLKEIADNLHISKSQLLSFENGEYLSNDLIEELICYYEIKNISLNNEGIFINNKVENTWDLKGSEDLINNYVSEIIDDAYYLSKYKTDFILNKLDLLFPYHLLHEYVFRILNSNYIINDAYFIDIEEVLLSTINLFSNEAQAIFKLARSYNCRLNGEYEISKKIVDEVISFSYNNIKIKIICKYYLFLISNNENDYSKSINLRDDLNLLFKEMPNKFRELKFMVAKSIMYKTLNALDRAIEIDRLGMGLSKYFDKTLYAIFSYNLAWHLSLQGKYNEAIEYYSIALETSPDNTTCFELAKCYYAEEDYTNCLKYINKSREFGMPIYKEYSNLFCDWLEVMLESSNNKKCETILLEIESKYKDIMHPDSRNFLYTQLSNYYKKEDDLKKALEYSLLTSNYYNYFI